MDKCPVCSSFETHEFSRDKKRIYFQCSSCSLIFVPRNLLIEAEEEKKRYEAHQNDEGDITYRSYLLKIRDSVEHFLGKEGNGLDFGCGKTTLLSDLLAEHGHKMTSYDLYFHPNEEIWKQKYDFIILSEVIEHLRDPLQCLRQLKLLLNPAAQVFIKTKFYPSEKHLFDNWFYKRDMTHVQFFNECSLNQLAQAVELKGKFKMIGEDLYRIID